ncbi:hypothetical protein I7I48_00428 [Histoplasma ohiense]|nr:hypothetical protein I7I48_00428 [Histoplasma ohiense (nom. inval.)]
MFVLVDRWVTPYNLFGYIFLGILIEIDVDRVGPHWAWPSTIGEFTKAHRYMIRGIWWSGGFRCSSLVTAISRTKTKTQG